MNPAPPWLPPQAVPARHPPCPPPPRAAHRCRPGTPRAPAPAAGRRCRAATGCRMPSTAWKTSRCVGGCRRRRWRLAAGLATRCPLPSCLPAGQQLEDVQFSDPLDSAGQHQAAQWQASAASGPSSSLNPPPLLPIGTCSSSRRRRRTTTGACMPGPSGQGGLLLASPHGGKGLSGLAAEPGPLHPT